VAHRKQKGSYIKDVHNEGEGEGEPNVDNSRQGRMGWGLQCKLMSASTQHAGQKYWPASPASSIEPREVN